MNFTLCQKLIAHHAKFEQVSTDIQSKESEYDTCRSMLSTINKQNTRDEKSSSIQSIPRAC